MSGTTLGLDLGPCSIGWALVNEGKYNIAATGVRIFPEGVDRDKQGAEVSKNETRRIARGMRRQIARRARRKHELRKLLVETGLLPADPAEQAKLDGLDPYELRRQGLTEELTPHQFGRLLVHLNQRRGFASNRKTDRAKRKETSDMLAEINELAKTIEDGDFKTLGNYFASLRSDPHRRIRGQHTRREMFQKEFETLWNNQQTYQPALLTAELKEQIERILFFQRHIYWPKSVIGRCELEPKRPRCPRAHRQAQRFRLLQEVNNLRVLEFTTGDERPLTTEERLQVIDYLSHAREKGRTFDEIRAYLGLHENARFNLERGKRKKLQGMSTDALLSSKNVFGKTWYDRSDEEKDAIVAQLLAYDRNDLAEDALRTMATEKWGLTAERADSLLGVDLPDGYMNFSIDAIQKLLPHMEQGLLLMTDDDTPSALIRAGYLRPDQRPMRTCDFLPPPPDLANPIVKSALHEVRKLINAIIREYGRPERIRIELARDVKGSARQRKERSDEMRDRQAERDDAAGRIREHGAHVSRDAIDRYLLWEEQGRICIYSGTPISLAHLLGGEVDVDHILPYSRSLDNSFVNKVVCFRSANAEKGDRTPYEWLAETQPKRHEEICQRAARLSYSKRRRFTRKNVEIDDFIARQLVDTAYISKAVAQYLRCLGAEVLCTKGQLTADLRWQWGLGSVLRNDGLELKNREDHRHHAIDAMVVALTDHRRLQQLAGIRRAGGTPKTGEILPEPWSHFREAVVTAVNAINVSHRVERKVAGALHEETVYGPTDIPGEFVCRKPLEALTPGMVEQIRDPVIRQIVTDRLKAFGIEPEGAGRIPAEAWKKPLLMPSGVPIRRVRMIRRDQTIQPIRGGTACVKPGNLHHLCLFEYIDDKGKTKREAVFVSALEAIQRIRDRQELIQRVHPERPDAKFIMSLSASEMVLAEFKGQERLMCFSTAASTQGQIYFLDARDARPSATRWEPAAKANTLKARKVTVDPLGRIRWAND